MMTSERLVAAARIADASIISAMNVEIPRWVASEAPTRASTISSTQSRASDAGTNEPTCAITAMAPSARMYVDLPPMLGPVTSMSRDPSRSST